MVILLGCAGVIPYSRTGLHVVAGIIQGPLILSSPRAISRRRLIAATR